MLTAGPISKMASQQEKDATSWCIFSKLCTKLTLHCNHRSGHLKTEHTESLFLLQRHLGNWPRSTHEKRAAGSAWETWKVAASDGVGCARVRWEINFLLTFETAQFFCVYPVCIGLNEKYLLFVSDINETRFFSTYFWKNTQISNFMEISPVGIQLFHADGRTDGHDEGILLTHLKLSALNPL